MSVLSTLLHATNFKTPFLRCLLPSIGLAFGIQAAVAIPSIAFQNEKFYDLSGSLTYLSCTALSLYLPTLRARAAASLTGGPLPPFPSLIASLTGSGAANAWNWRQLVLSLAVSIWATRLGTFLFARISDEGKDSRFDEIRGSAPKFFGAFMAQATWVSLCLMPILCVNAIPATTLAALPVGITEVVGLLLYVGGITFEATADRQKSQWLQEKKDKKHSDEFLARGVWSKSRHPNYFGESTLWTGIATAAAGTMLSSVGQSGMGMASWGVAGKATALGLAFVSPAFVTFLLLKVSGVPPTEASHNKKFGDNKEYQKWKRETPLFIPKL